MREIQSCGMSLNISSVQAVICDAKHNEYVILRGHAAQETSWMCLLEALTTELSKSRMNSIAFYKDNRVHPTQVEALAYDGETGTMRKIGHIYSLAVPVGFDTGNPLLNDPSR